MRDDLLGDSPKSIWLNQPTETRTMTLQLIQLKLRELRAKTRRKSLQTLTAPLAVGVFYALALTQFADLREGLQPAFAIALVWSLAGLFFLNLEMWSASTPDDTGLATGLQFCQREIERQRDLVRRSLLWSFGPVLLAIGACCGSGHGRNARSGNLAERANLPGSPGHLDTRVLHHQAAGTAESSA